MPSTSMKNRLIAFPPDMFRAVAKAAERRSTSFTAVVRTAVAEHLGLPEPPDFRPGPKTKARAKEKSDAGDG